MEKRDFVVDLWADLDKPRVWFVEEVKDGRAKFRPVKLVPKGEVREVVHNKYVMQWLIVSRTGKKKAGP